MPGWSNGRVTLVGDAGRGHAPLSGQEGLGRRGGACQRRAPAARLRRGGKKAPIGEHAAGKPAEEAIVRASRATQLRA
ncbi:MAG: hypothetical protein JO023_15390 [Chloroflexi bacterium]|nr:hypothetical protein [Chloroflexota bacterium]